MENFENNQRALLEYGVHRKWWKHGYSFEFLCNSLLFKDINLRDKKILDVGAGRGLYSLWVALSGASSVVALEPSTAGSRNIKSNIELIDAISVFELSNIEISNNTYQEYSPDNPSFDLILLKDSVNHLDESACETLKDSEQSRNTFLEIFGKVHGMLADQGIVIITDCSDRNFFGDLGLKNPMANTIEWNKHQHPGVWSRLLAEAGFSDIDICWHVPAYFLKPGQMISNEFTAYLTTSWFRITARR